jgi:hypothetical protein
MTTAISQSRQITKSDAPLEVEMNTQADENPTNRATQNGSAKGEYAAKTVNSQSSPKISL